MYKSYSRGDADKAMIGLYIGSAMEEGEKFKFAFMGAVQGNPDDGVLIWPRHWDREDGYTLCKRAPGEPPDVCPKCAKGSNRQMRVQLAVWGLGTNQQHILEMSYGWLKSAEGGMLEENDAAVCGFTLKAVGAKKTIDREYHLVSSRSLTEEELIVIKQQVVFSGQQLLGKRGDVDDAPDYGHSSQPPIPEKEDLPF